MGPGEAHTSSVMDLPSDIDPLPHIKLKRLRYDFKLMITAFYILGGSARTIDWQRQSNSNSILVARVAYSASGARLQRQR